MVEQIIQRIENSSTSYGKYIFSFIFVIFIRTFIELYSDSSKLALESFIHYFSFYICLGLNFVLLLSVISKEKIDKILRVTIVGSPIIILPPLFDMMINGGEGFGQTYLYVSSVKDALIKYVTYFDITNNHGITPGMKVEMFIIIGMIFGYVYFKSKSIKRGVLSAVSAYSMLFLYAIMPVIYVAFWKVFSFQIKMVNVEYTRIYYSASLILAIIIAWREWPTYTRAFFRDGRWLRVFYYLLMLCLGIIVGLRSDGVWQKVVLYIPELASGVFVMAIAVVFSIFFAIIINNIEDKEIDQISNSSRPHITGQIPSGIYSRLSWLFLGIGLVGASLINFPTLFLFIVFNAVYYLYSAPPFRFKRVPFFSKIAISINSVALMTAGSGYFTFSILLPKIFSLYLFFIIWMCANFIDIKDFDGDRCLKIKTLPTLMGLAWSKRLIGFFFLISFPISSIVFQETWLLWFMTPAALIIYYFINRKKYRENEIFLSIFFVIISMMTLISLEKLKVL